MVSGNVAYSLPAEDLLEIEVAETPLKFCTVTLSDVISRGKRLEASVFGVEAKQAISIVENSKYGYHPLVGKDSSVKAAYHAPRFKRNYVDRYHVDAVGFLGSAEMLDCYPSPEKYITNSMAHELRLFAPEHAVLVSCSGTIGNISFVNKSLEKYALSQHIIRLECSEYSGYLYACLKHPSMQKQLDSLVYGAVIQEIEPYHLEKVIIPDAPAAIKKRINDLIVESYTLRDESNALIDEATGLLVNELQLPDINSFDVALYKKKANVDTFSVKLSEMAGRIDASYHLPIVDAIVDHLKKHSAEVTTIGDKRISADVVLPGRFKRVYVDKEYGVKLLGGKEMNQLVPSTEKYLSKKAHKKQLEGTLGIKEHSLLTPARGSLGEVVMPPKHFINWAISDNLMQIISFNNVFGYLYVFLNTEYGRALIQRYTYGGVVDAIEPEHIKRVEIPLLKNKEIQTRINELALEANQKRYEAFQLEQEAIRILDTEVIYAK